MASKLKIKVNGLVESVSASLDMPLLYLSYNEQHPHGPTFGCWLAGVGPARARAFSSAGANHPFVVVA
jgi:hypothetical protein